MPNTHSIDLEESSIQHLTALDSASLSVTGNMTIELWFKTETLENRYLITKFNEAVSGQRSYEVQLNDDGDISVFISANGAAYTGVRFDINAFASTGVWYHLAVVYTAASGKVEIFKNGVSQGSNTTFPTSIFNSTEVFVIGADLSLIAFGISYDGKIDEVRLWSKARTGAEILADYLTQLVGNETSLNAYWKLDNALTDTTANANTLTNVNTATFSTDVPFSGQVGPANLKSYNTNLSANVKSINTNLIANVKSFDTNI